MTLLSTTDLSMARTAQEDALPETCEVRRVSYTSDGQGGYTELWLTIATAVPYRRSPVGTPTEERFADRLEGRLGWVLTFAHDADVLATDRIVDSTSQYEVIGLQSGGDWATAKRVVVVEIT